MTEHLYGRRGGYLGVVQRDPGVSEGGSEREERDGNPAGEVGEDKQRHPLRDPRVVRIPREGPADGAVHPHVTRPDQQEGEPVRQHDETHVA